MPDDGLDLSSSDTYNQLYDTYYRRGISYRKSGDYQEAIQQYTKAIEIKPDDPMVFFRRGIALKLTDNYNDALADFTKSITLNPDYDRVYIERGITFHFLGNYDAAINDLMKAIQLNPIDKETKNILLEIQKDTAVRLLKKSLKNMLHIEKDDKEYWVGYHNQLGIILYDPLSQVGLESVLKVRFFILDKKHMTKIDPKDIFKNIQTSLSQNVAALNKAVDLYHDFRSNRRVTHCYSCKSDLNSVDFDICEKCGWIRCQCNACGCDYHAYSF